MGAELVLKRATSFLRNQFCWAGKWFSDVVIGRVSRAPITKVRARPPDFADDVIVMLRERVGMGAFRCS